MRKEDFYFELPENLIAQTPIVNRSESRLLVLDKKDGSITHKTFGDIIGFFNEGDCLVINDTRVIPARLLGNRKKTGGNVEFLLLNRSENDTWEVLVYPGKKARRGDIIEFGNGILSAEILDITETGNRVVRFDYEGVFEQLLDKLGEMPLPPYINEKLDDRERYQTVYAKNNGSSAAPTAGLHFTDEIFKKLEEKKVNVAKITLHIGLGTFRPVKTSNILEHKMHSEIYCIDKSQADIINESKAKGGKIIAVGTTSCRTLETCADENGFLKYGSGSTDIFIYPGYKFKIVDNLITNFHLPESTLIMLVSALCGREVTLNAYNEAVRLGYRFFSFGDAMFIGEMADGNKK